MAIGPRNLLRTSNSKDAASSSLSVDQLVSELQREKAAFQLGEGSEASLAELESKEETLNRQIAAVQAALNGEDLSLVDLVTLKTTLYQLTSLLADLQERIAASS